MPGSVGGSQNEHTFVGRLHPVHLGQELVDELPPGMVAHVAPAGAERVHLVKEQNARGMIPRLFEKFVEISLTVPDPHVENVINPNRDEPGLDFTRGGSRQVGLAAAGRAVHQDAAASMLAVGAKQVGLDQRVDDLHADLFFQLVPGEITLPEVLVEAREPVIERTRTSAKTTFDAEEREGLPVSDVTDLISTAPGVYGPFIRGAHQYDSRVYVDGIDVTDRSASWLAERIGFTNASFLENTMHAARAGKQAFLYPSAFAVEQATVYAGMAGADYGSAPGVITYALKEGRGTWHGGLQFRMSQLGGLQHEGPSVYNDASAYYAARDAFARNSDPATRQKAAYFTWTPEKYRYSGDPTYNLDFGMGGQIAEWVGAYIGGGWSDVRGRLPNERTRQANATVKRSFRSINRCIA